MNNKWTWLKEYMQKNNISQGEVADALQWQKTRVSELLGGKRDFPVNKVFPAARFLTSIWRNLPNTTPVFQRDPFYRRQTAAKAGDGRPGQNRHRQSVRRRKGTGFPDRRPTTDQRRRLPGPHPCRPRQHKSNDCPRRCHAADHQRRRPDLGRRFHQNPYFGRPLPVCAERRSLCQKAAAGQFQPLGRHYLRQPALSADRHQQTGQTLHPRQSHIRHQNLPLIPFRRRQGLLCKKRENRKSSRFYRIKSYSAVLFPFSLFLRPAGRKPDRRNGPQCPSALCFAAAEWQNR